MNDPGGGKAKVTKKIQHTHYKISISALHTLHPPPGCLNLLFGFSNRYLNTYCACTTPIQNSVWRLLCIETSGPRTALH
jgi:hypothetical protein